MCWCLLCPLFCAKSLKSQALDPAARATTSPASPLTEVIAMNALQGKDKQPFHLRMSFQLFDLEGKAFEQGTLEEWWAGPNDVRLDVTTPSLGTIHALRAGGVSQDSARRSIFLIGDLLSSTAQPAGTLNAQSEVKVKLRDFGSIQLQCFETGQGSNVLDVCTGPADKTIRAVIQPGRTLVRNRIGKFAGSEIGLDQEILYAGKSAIRGSVETLESFQPAKASTDPAADHAASIPLSGHVTAGTKISGSPPLYPGIARSRHVSGSVLLGVHIDEAGRVTYAFPISSPDPSLSEASLAAVKDWTYKPFLLNEKPVGLDTVLTMNFNLNR